MIRILSVGLISLGVSVTSVHSVVKADPIGKGVLGATEEQVALKLGQPDEKYSESLAKSAKGPRPPVARSLVYRLKKSNIHVTIGFDDKGIARTAELFAGARQIPPDMILALCNTIAADWVPAPRMGSLFPPIGNRSIGYTGYRIPGLKIWEISIRGKQELDAFRVPDRVEERGISKQISVCKGSTAYAVGEVRFEPRKVHCESLVVADADTFWKWTFDHYLQIWKEGWPKRDFKPKPGVTTEQGPSGYDAEFASRMGSGRGYDPKYVAARLMTPAILELVRNPAADLRPAGLAVQLLNERHDQALAPHLAKLLQSESKAVRARAAQIMAKMDDPALVQPLILALGGKSPVPAAVDALKHITGQDLGDDKDAWKQWWQENGKSLQDAHAARKRERAGQQVTVAVARGGKLYHIAPQGDEAPGCPTLRRASIGGGYDRRSLEEARENALQPCPKCNPPR